SAAGLIDRLAELRRRHRLMGEGVKTLFHLADHGLPDRDRIVALVGHRRPPAIIARGFSSPLTGHTTPLRLAGQQRARRAVSHRRIESLLRRRKPWHRVPSP